jgi:hypothetical protein
MVLLGVSFLGVESSLSRQARRLLYCGASSFVKRFCRCPSKSCLLIRMPNARKRLTTSSHNPICGNTPYGAFLRCQKRLSLSLIPARKDRNPLCRPQRLPLGSLRVFCGVSRRFPAGLPGFAIAWPEARTESPVFASGRRRSSCTANRSSAPAFSIGEVAICEAIRVEKVATATEIGAVLRAGRRAPGGGVIWWPRSTG